MNQKEDEKLDIELDERIADGIYSNLAIVNHSMTEFVIDFVTVMPGSNKAKVKSRVILAPDHAKRLVKVLNDNIENFEIYHSKSDEEKDLLPINYNSSGIA